MTKIVKILKNSFEGKKMTEKERKILDKAQNKQCEFSKIWLRGDEKK
ncbi:MAG: hypothetical protein RLZZ577_57 [Bacteroidota bacterium]|jgi:hypothetical protein